VIDIEHNKKLVKTLYETVFRNHDFSKLDEIMRDDYIQHNPDTPQGKTGFEEFFRGIFRGLPDFSYTMKKIISEGDIVMMYSTTTATHNNEWLGNPPTGNKLEFDVVDIFRIEDGKIAEHWDVADTLKLFTGVGKVKNVR
jgi:predicted SnoaL-like aldol condensation-catalyzing enzyme